MSFDDCVEVRALAKMHSFRVRSVGVAYSLSSKQGTRGRRGELLIRPA